MDEALKLARIAAQQGEVPVGCVVVLDGQIVGKGYNQREGQADPVAHAEIIALRDAAAHLKRWRLTGAVVYVSLEPCPMCAGALINSRIERLVYGCSDPKSGACGTLYNIGQDPRLNHLFEITKGVKEKESAQLLKSFFKERRKQGKRKSKETTK